MKPAKESPTIRPESTTQTLSGSKAQIVLSFSSPNDVPEQRISFFWLKISRAPLKKFSKPGKVTITGEWVSGNI